MTCILWRGDCLFADSIVIKGMERLHTLSKIYKVMKPFKMTSEKYPMANDVIYGWACTGLTTAAEEFMVSLGGSSMDKKPFSLDFVEKLYNSSVIHKLNNQLNTFTILAVGEKHNYTFAYDLDGFRVECKTKDMMISIGSGNVELIDKLKEGWDPIRAYFHVFYVEPGTCGGIIDVWQHSKKGKKLDFHRLGLIGERTKEELPLWLLNHGAPVPFDMVTPPVQIFLPPLPDYGPKPKPVPAVAVEEAAPSVEQIKEIIKKHAGDPAAIQREAIALIKQVVRIPLARKPVAKKVPAKKAVRKKEPAAKTRSAPPQMSERPAHLGPPYKTKPNFGRT